MALNFPSSPNVGDQYTSGGVIWVWDGNKWTAGGISEAYLPLAGGTMSGPIMLPADPTANLQATTKQYVDAINPAGKYLPLGGGTITGALVVNSAAAVLGGLCSTLAGAPPLALQSPPTNDSSNAMPTTSWVNANARYGDNKIINGDMLINQRGVTSNNGTINTYTVDRWAYSVSQFNRLSWTQTSAAGSSFANCLTIGSLSAYTPLASDALQLYQGIEADAIADLMWGTSNAQPVTLSFWTASNQTGMFSGCISNDTGARSYPFTFSIPTANVWTKCIVTIPGDTSGTWTLSGNGVGLYIHFDLGSGATYRGPAGAWVSSNLIGANGAASLVTVNGAYLNFTGVKLEVGSIATPFNRQSLAKNLDDCRRYYQMAAGLLISGYNAASNAFYGAWPLSPPMRAAPTLTLSNITYGNASGLVQWNINSTIWGVSAIITAAGTGGWVIFSATLDAEL